MQQAHDIAHRKLTTCLLDACGSESVFWFHRSLALVGWQSLRILLLNN
jgi:hypothetical protein